MNDPALDWLTEQRGRILDDFDALLRIPGISTDPSYAGDVARAAAWVAASMERAGLGVEVARTDGHPVVIGRHVADAAAPTLLVYAHYDVQPADPLDEWTTPPFEPSVRDGIVYGRGAADDKAQVILQVAAAEAALSTGGLPVNLILLFEGEEEVGSPNLATLVRRRADDLAADHVVIADSMMFAPGRPSLIFGTRGLAYLEIEVEAAGRDLHSGQYGGAVANPVHALARIIASFHDDTGRVAVEGFYDAVADAPGEVRDAWRELGYDEAAFQASAGGAPPTGEAGWSTPERLWIRPCLDVNGIVGGYTGPGKKTVLPGRASAKVSTRLVPDQDPGRVADLLERHVRRHAPPDVTVHVRRHQANHPWRADPDTLLYDAASAALEGAFGVAPARVCHGGTLPIARDFAGMLTPSVAVMGFALPGANMHAPDEWIPADQLHRGAAAMVRLYRELATRSRT